MSGPFAGVGVSLPIVEEIAVPDLVDMAISAEQRGFSSVWVGEMAGPEIFGLLSAIASSTRRVRLGTGVVCIFARSAALTAMGFVTLDALAPGRCVAGIGVGSRFTVENWHNARFDHAPQALVEYTQALRSGLSGERVAHPGDHVNLTAFRVALPKPGPIPIYFGPLSPLGLRLTGRLADGAVLTFCPLAEVAGRVAAIRDSAAAAGRDPSHIEVVTYVNCYVGDDPAAIERMRRLVAQYAVQPTHARAFAGVFDDLAEAQRRWAEGDRAGAAALVTDDVVAAVTPVGDAATVVDRLEALHRAGVDEAVVLPQVSTRGDAAAAVRTMHAVADEIERRRGAPTESTRRP